MEEGLPQLKIVTYTYLQLIILCFITTLLIKIILKYYKVYRNIRNIPGPSVFWMFGHLHNIVFSKDYFGQQFFKLSQNYSICKTWMGPTFVIVVNSPKYIKTLLQHEKLLKKPFLYKRLGDIVGKGLITLSGSVWRKHRKIIAQSFNNKMLNPLIGIFEEKSKTLVDVLNTRVETKYINLYNNFVNYTADTVCQTSLGVETNYLKSQENFGLVTERLAYLCGRWTILACFYPDFLGKLSSTYKEYSSLLSLYHYQISQIRKKCKLVSKDDEKNGETLEINGKNKIKTLLDPLIKHPKITEAHIRDEISTFISAGAETTARTLNFVAVVLGMYPHIQQKVYEEIIDIFGNKHPVTAEGLTMMNYTERVIKETLRIFPTVPIIGREASEDIQLDDKIIPAGSVVLINILMLHRNPEYWSDPLKFDPDRFLPEESSKRDPNVYIPFSIGSRMCIGWKYAMINMKTVLIEILRNFKIHTEYKTIDEINIVPLITTHIKGSSKLWLEKRNN